MFFYRIRQCFLFLIDLLLLIFSLWLSIFIRYERVFDFRWHFLNFLPIFFLWLFILYIFNFYNLNFLKEKQNLYLNLFQATLINFILAVIIFYFSKPNFTPKRILFLNLLIFSFLFFLWRLIALKFLFKIPLENLLIISDTEDARDLIKRKEALLAFGFRLKVFIELEKKDFSLENNIRLEKSLENFEKLIEEEKISTVVVSNLTKYPEIVRKLYHLLPKMIRVFDLTSFYEYFLKEIPISSVSEVWFLENFYKSKRYLYDYLKRIIDILVSLIFGLVFLFSFPFIALGIYLFSPGPIFYKQKRVGKDGKEFVLTKFRTMIIGAEKNGPVWSFKNDPRVTPFGRFLRASHLDELPQFLNILKGEMSLVGPRPERPEFVKELAEKIPHYHLRHLVKPGLTGWAQINYPYGSSVEDALKKLHFDLYYIKNRSLFLDISIVLRTINIFLRQPNS